MLSLAAEPYPSRRIDEAVLARRMEPVIWGDQAHPPKWLSPSCWKSYLEHGFMVLPELLSGAEIRLLQQEMELLSVRFTDRSHDFIVREAGSDAIRTIFDMQAVSLVFSRLLRHPRLVALARHILDSDVYIHQSRLNYKPGFTGREFYWHSDFETWHIEDGMPAMRALSCVVLLTENNVYNGPLMVIPGSHRTYVGCVGDTPTKNYQRSLVQQTVGTPPPEALSLLIESGGISSITGPAGTVALFDCNLLHGSTANMTPMPRSNAFFVYNSVLNRLGPPQHKLEPRPEYIAHRAHAAALPAVV